MLILISTRRRCVTTTFGKICQSWFLVILLSFLAGAGNWSYDRAATYGKGLFNYSIFAGFPFQEKKIQNRRFKSFAKFTGKHLCSCKTEPGNFIQKDTPA